jgi:hypothetical protein
VPPLGLHPGGGTNFKNKKFWRLNMEKQIRIRDLISSMEAGAELKLKVMGDMVDLEIRIFKWPDKFYCSLEFQEKQKGDLEFHYGYVSGDFRSMDALISFLGMFNFVGNTFVEFKGSFYTLLG